MWFFSIKIWFLLLGQNRHKLCHFGRNLILLFKCFGFCWIRVCWLINFAMLNRSNNPHPHCPQMKNTCPFYIVFQILKVILIKLCKIQSPDFLLLLVFISFYISRYHFSQIFRTSFKIIWKKDFRHEFSFLNRFTPTRVSILTPPSD